MASFVQPNAAWIYMGIILMLSLSVMPDPDPASRLSEIISDQKDSYEDTFLKSFTVLSRLTTL